MFIHGDLQTVHVFVDVDAFRAYWTSRSLMSTRWLAEHGYGAPETFPEVAVLDALAARS